MISDHAHNQNMAKKKAFIGLGYKFSTGADGWTIWFDDQEVASGITPFAKGEDGLRQSLDAAIGRAVLHQKQHVQVIKPEPTKPTTSLAEIKKTLAKKEPAPKTEPEPKSSDLKLRAVHSAIGFLKMVGATYTITFEGEKFSNIPPKPDKPVRQYQNIRQYYLPLFAALGGKREFEITLPIPIEIDQESYRNTVVKYVENTYGKGCYVSEADSKARTLKLIVVATKDAE